MLKFAVVKTGTVQFVKLPEAGVPNAPLNNTGAPAEPVLVDSAVAIPVPSPDTPDKIGKPVALVSVALEGVPNAPPLTTAEPTAPILDANAVATPVPNPLTPVEIGSPVAFVKVTDAGVPKTGVTKVGLVLSTLLPEPVEVVTPVPPLATGKVPVTLEVKLTNVVEEDPVPPFAVPKTPPNVTAPDVPVDGVSPVVPALNEVTPADIALMEFCTYAVVAI